jgi:hypothetical protein
MLFTAIRASPSGVSRRDYQPDSDLDSVRATESYIEGMHISYQARLSRGLKDTMLAL